MCTKLLLIYSNLCGQVLLQVWIFILDHGSHPWHCDIFSSATSLLISHQKVLSTIKIYLWSETWKQLNTEAAQSDHIIIKVNKAKFCVAPLTLPNKNHNQPYFEDNSWTCLAWTDMASELQTTLVRIALWVKTKLTSCFKKII